MAKRRNQTRQTLTQALHALLPDIEEDLRARSEVEPDIRSALEEEHRTAFAAHRTGQTFNDWRDEVVTQIAVAWTLACVFVRFLEDNELVDVPRISGPITPTDRRQRAIDEQARYFERTPTHNERDYLESTFREFAKLPALSAILGPANANLWRFGPSVDGAKSLLDFFRRIDDASEAPKLLYDFVDASLSTRFLGDLYQDLSEEAQKRYALLQTPAFVEEFILDRTLEPAIAEFGMHGLRMIDPTVGSGHFLLGGFARLLERWQKAEPGTEVRVLAQRVLDSLFGVDLNPFAVEICRFRLLIAALKASSATRLADAPNFRTNVAVGDSLLHGPRFNDPSRKQSHFEFPDVESHTYRHEDKAELALILSQRYHAVVGNPPYITVKDKALNEVYRERYGSCKGKYALSIPFLERFVELASPREGGRAAGFVGQITSNSFMKREFGSKLIEEFMPRWELTHVIDASGAHIPGHGTPTVILLLRNQPPVQDTVRTVLGIRGEIGTPEDPAKGPVWCAIVHQVDRPGSQSEYVSVEEKSRDTFGKHPWSIGGGGASDLRGLINDRAIATLSDRAEAIGIFGMTNADDGMLAPGGAFKRKRVEAECVSPLFIGDDIRDWVGISSLHALFPYRHEELVRIADAPGLHRWLWSSRTVMGNRATFARATYFEEGRPWWEWHQVALERMRTKLTITYAFVATHNHFVLDRGGVVFNRSAPIIKLPSSATEDDHLVLLGLLNSSTACFWLQQVCHNKGGPGGGSSKDEKWKDFYEHTATVLADFPVPKGATSGLAQRLQALADTLATDLSPIEIARNAPLAMDLAHMREKRERCIAQMIALQEELDWSTYSLFGLTEGSLTSHAPPPIVTGQRAFEIVAARDVHAGRLSTRWFEWCGALATTDIPSDWPTEYQQLVSRRIREIADNPDVRLIEQMSFKRRWEREPFEVLLHDALRVRILDVVEALPVWKHEPPSTVTARALADGLVSDEAFNSLIALYTDQSAPDLESVLVEVLSSEHVPFLAALRYTEAGLRKREDWEETWQSQREEDSIDALVALPRRHLRKLDETDAKLRKVQEVGDIPVPPKYASGDFQKSSYWSNRGKLDVPKERFISYPLASPDNDGTLLLGWAGWDHKQQAAALGAHFMKMRDAGWEPERLRPLLAGIAELVPWLKQWHGNDPEHGDLGAFYEQFLETECAKLGLQMHELSEWRPPQRQRGRAGKKKTKTEVDETLVEEDAG